MISQSVGNPTHPAYAKPRFRDSADAADGALNDAYDITKRGEWNPVPANVFSLKTLSGKGKISWIWNSPNPAYTFKWKQPIKLVKTTFVYRRATARHPSDRSLMPGHETLRDTKKPNTAHERKIKRLKG